MKRRLTVYIFLIAALSVVISSAVGAFFFHQREVDAARQTLTELLSLMDAEGAPADVDGLLAQFAQAAPDKRLTLIAADGTVLGDTEPDISEDHSGRPEVEQALSSGSGEDIRRSASNGVSYLYEARVFDSGIIARAAMPLSSVNALALQATMGLLAAAVVALCLAWVLARRLAANTAKPVEAAEVAVRQVDETLQSARSEFTANVTHELKTPLTSIKGFTDMMASGLVKDPEDQKRFLAMISVEVDRLTKLVDDILQVTELETVAGVLPGERCALTELARDTAKFLEPVAQKANVAITVSGDKVEGAIGADRFREVALNLMENAVKYNQSGGQVDVTLGRENGWAVFTVADTGIGIPRDSQSRVFERFYRVDKGRSRAAGGTGLGLAIVKHIVALYGGRIDLDSEVGAGTTITVRLPLAP